MLNGFLTFYYEALNSSCYDGNSAPGGEAGGTEGLGTGSVRPLLRARRFVPTGHAAHQSNHDQEHKTLGFRLPGGLRVR